MVYTNEKGELTVNAQLYNDLTYQILNQLVSSFNQVVDNLNNGLQLPNKTTAEIVAYAADITVPIGTLWFDTSTGKLVFKTGTGTYETVTST
jgi:hypothetical protein